MFGNLGPTEIIFLAVFLLLIFGAKRLPELGAGLGKGIREFKKSMNEIHTEIERPAPQDQLRAAPPPPAQQVPTATTAENKDGA